MTRAEAQAEANRLIFADAEVGRTDHWTIHYADDRITVYSNGALLAELGIEGAK